MTVQDWQDIAAGKKQAVDDSIPPEWRLGKIPSVEEVRNAREFIEEALTKEEREITNLPIKELSGKLASRELTSVAVTRAFCHRAALAHQLTTCCSEIFFDRALQKAQELDEFLMKEGKTIGPLHGVPISLKDQVNLEGIDSAIGYVSLVNKPKSKDEVSNIATILEDAGAVFYVKTTTPMAMMAATTVSNIYGYTLNAYNRKLTSGGSSGGEGALIGARGSLIGLGTDLGGSIRTPSMFQGLYGLRPSSNRLPYCKVTNSYANAPIICSVIGPISWDLDALELLTKVVLEAKPWLKDPKVPPIPWRDVRSTYPKKLSFAMLTGNGLGRLHPPIERALKLARQALEAQGHQVIEWAPPVSVVECRKFSAGVFSSDSYKEIVDECSKSGEPLVKAVFSLAGTSGGLPKGVSHIHEHWDQAKTKYEYQQLVDAYWQSTASETTTGRPVDAVIMPQWESCSFKPDDLALFSRSYSVATNVLDYACVVTPVTVADKYIDVKDESYIPLNDHDQKLYDYYDAELFDGVPAGVQVVTPRYEEERALYLSSVLRDAL
ncbi:hypothetical protein CAAN3_18S00386 [[Candida] anglica]